tara:strand:- start:5694 stop:6560 length:867 start_codon:yes stop_codon:yes gene_type:complete
MNEYFSIIDSKKLNKEEYSTFLDNKLAFSLLCKKNKVVAPKVWSYNFGNNFYLNEKIYHVTNKIELCAFFRLLFESTKIDRFFLKLLGSIGRGGKGIYLLNYSHLEADVERFGDIIMNNSYIHQEPIIQHPLIDKIYSKSVNTLRIYTYIDNNGKTHLLDTVMRFGTAGSVLDNKSLGGFFVPVDMSTGKLTKKGVQGMIHGGRHIYQHPDTNFVFNEFEIPFFKEAHEMCLQLVEYIPNRLNGWDIAITPNGPVVIEGNTRPGILMGEIGYGGYLKHPLIQEILSII